MKNKRKTSTMKESNIKEEMKYKYLSLFPPIFIHDFLFRIKGRFIEH